MTTTRPSRDGRVRRRRLLCLVLLLTTAGCSAAEPAFIWPWWRWGKAPVPREPWPTAAQEWELSENSGPLRAGSTVLQPPSGTEAQVAAAPFATSADAPAGPANTQPAPPTPEMMAEVLSELQTLNQLTPTEQQRLLDNMKGTEPAAWPQLVRNYRETLAKNAPQPKIAGDNAQLVSHNEPMNSEAVAATASTSDAAPKPIAADQPPAASDPKLAADWKSQLMAAVAALSSQGSATALPTDMSAAISSLDEARACVSEHSPLVLKNLAFCTEVTSFGVYKPFEKREFAPGQEVLLYAEIENFRSERRPDGFHTALDSEYQIVDAAGKRIEARHFGLTHDTCRNARRDFFIRYQFHLPRDIGPGTYTLQLTISDTLGRKTGQASIELVVQPK